MNRVYISGKISGLPMNVVTEKFDRAERQLIEDGFTHVVNPLKLNHAHNINFDWETFMKTDLKALLDCNTIFMLPCWQDSPGAKIELQTAIALNYSIIWCDYKPLSEEIN